MKRVATVGLIMATAIAGCGGDSTLSGYHDMTKLSAAVKQIGVDAMVEANITGYTITDVTCISQNKNRATCHATASNGDTSVHDVDVSPDGKTFITHAGR